MRLNKLQNSISYMGDTVLQPTDRQHIAEPHLLLVTTFSQFMLIINHLQLKVDAGFSTLSMFSLNITPLRLKVADMGRTIQSTFVFRTAKHKTPRILR